MTITHRVLVVAAILTGTAALAHKNVQNPDVKARMAVMSEVGKNTKTLGLMAKGAAKFDAKTARAAAAAIAEHAAQTPVVFQNQADDPKSEALPAIWDDFDDFTAKAVALKDTAAAAAMTITSRDDLKLALGRIGAACKSCHSSYRE